MMLYAAFAYVLAQRWFILLQAYYRVDESLEDNDREENDHDTREEVDDTVSTDVVASQADLESSVLPPVENDGDIHPKNVRDLKVDFGEGTSDD